MNSSATGYTKVGWVTRCEGWGARTHTLTHSPEDLKRGAEMLSFSRQTRDILRHVGCPNSVDFLFRRVLCAPNEPRPERDLGSDYISRWWSVT